MEGRGEDNRDLEIPNSRLNYNPPQIIQESLVKLPLAPIQDRRPIPTRRGISIFSPTQTLDYHHQPVNRPPLLPPQGPTPDPDPADSEPPPSSPQRPPPPASSIRYRECLKNHAASMGSHVVDGCGEFMPGGEEGTSEAMRCAACDCHRNFHRKEAGGHAPPPNRSTPASKRPTMVNFGGAAEESSSEDLNNNNALQYSSGGGHAGMRRGSKKRFRTKFSHEQKERMQELAEKIGWRIQKQDEEEVNKFCHESGVKRQVFKVWMHNNKQALKKRQPG